MDALFAGVGQSLSVHGLPVILGECGASRWVPLGTPEDNRKLQSRAYYYQYLTVAARRNGFAPFFWDNGNTETGVETFGLFDRKDHMKPDRLTIQGIMNGLSDGD